MNVREKRWNLFWQSVKLSDRSLVAHWRYMLSATVTILHSLRLLSRIGVCSKEPLRTYRAIMCRFSRWKPKGECLV